MDDDEISVAALNEFGYLLGHRLVPCKIGDTLSDMIDWHGGFRRITVIGEISEEEVKEFNDFIVSMGALPIVRQKYVYKVMID